MIPCPARAALNGLGLPGRDVGGTENAARSHLDIETRNVLLGVLASEKLELEARAITMNP